MIGAAIHDPFRTFLALSAQPKYSRRAIAPSIFSIWLYIGQARIPRTRFDGRETNMRIASASTIAGLLIAGTFFTTLTLADNDSDGAPVILSPMDGAVVRSPVTVIVGFEASDAMHGEDTKPAT